MRSAIPVLALLLLALITLPLAPAGEYTVTAPSDTGGHAYRFGQGLAGQAGHNPGMAGGPGGAGPADPGSRHRHGAPADTVVRQELRRDPFDGYLPVRSVRFRGYRRLTGKNILEQENRQIIWQTILANPGIGIAALAESTGINLHTLRYHLGYLMRLKKIACLEQGSGYHFFENHGRFGDAEQQRILWDRYPTTNRILGLIAARPGITRGTIAGELGLAGPSVTRWTQRLVAGGVVMEIRDGRQVHYYPADPQAGIPA